jgi:Ca2+-binding RTX toxin-like protein
VGLRCSDVADPLPTVARPRIAAVAGVIAALVALSAAPSRASDADRRGTLTCFGRTPTRVGTSGNDVIRGTKGRDVIVGIAGDDRIRGGGGADLVCGGTGGDVLLGGRGRDVLAGGHGDDRLVGRRSGSTHFRPGAGNDVVIGSRAGPDSVHFEEAVHPVVADLEAGFARGQGFDQLVAIDALFGGPYADRLRGDDRSNRVVGRAGNDTLIGRGGRDFLSGQGADDVLRGGPGVDLAEYYGQNHIDDLTYGPMRVNLRTGRARGNGSDRLAGIEGATGSDGDDTMIGNNRANLFFWLYGGADIVMSHGGADFVDAGMGPDLLDGGGGNDALSFFDGMRGRERRTPLTLHASGGTDSDGDSLSGFHRFFGSANADVLVGDGARNVLVGYRGNDDLSGRGNDDLIIGGQGDDRADGGTGVDRCYADRARRCEGGSARARSVAGGGVSRPLLTLVNRAESGAGGSASR